MKGFLFPFATAGWFGTEIDLSTHSDLPFLPMASPESCFDSSTAHHRGVDEPRSLEKTLIGITLPSYHWNLPTPDLVSS